MYNISVNKPKSDNEKRISGTINYVIEPMNSDTSNVFAIGTLENIPIPFLNQVTGILITKDIIGPIKTNKKLYSNIQLTKTLEESIISEIIIQLKSEFLILYGSSIDLIVKESLFTNDNNLKENNNFVPKVSMNSEQDDNKKLEYIFNVENEGIFRNFELGELTIIGKDDDTFIFGDNTETIDPEYLESQFDGPDEDPFVLPSEDISKFEQELDSGAISSNIYEIDNTPIVTGTIKGNMKLIAEASRSIGLISKYAIASMIAIASGESGLKPQEEGHVYSLENVSRVFRGMSFDQKRRASTRGISKIQFFSIVYGEYSPSRVGNRNISDGGLYYGRGFIQLTGYENYSRYNKLLKRYFPNENIDIVQNPNLVNDSKISAKLVALYFLDRVNVSQNSISYFESSLRAVGRDANGGYDKKRKFYNKLISENSIA